MPQFLNNELVNGSNKPADGSKESYLDRSNNNPLSGFNDLFGGFSDAITSIFDGLSTIQSGTQTEVKEAETIHKTNYEEIWGLPPLAYIGDDGSEAKELTMNRILQSMLVITLEPCKPSYQGINGDTGLDLYKLVPIPTSGKGSIPYLLNGTDIKPLKSPFKLAVQADSAFTESWSTQFGESQFENAANVGSALGQEIRFVTGQESLTKGISDIMNGVGTGIGMIPGIGDTLQGMLNNANQGFTNVGTSVEDSLNQTPIGRGLTHLASGSKIDFPQIWQGSEYSTSYSFTLKLYNPFPNDKKSYFDYILSPLAHMLLFMCPVSDSNFTFGFPILCKFSCPGLGGIEAAYISNLDVIKGGSNGDISFTQRPGTIEIRFSIQPLYNTMLIRGEQDVNEERPTLDSYIKHLRGSVEIPSIYTSNTKTYSSDNGETLVNVDPFFNRDYGNKSTRKDINLDFDPLNVNADYSISRNSLESLDAFSDPILNDLFKTENTLSDINISSVANYKKEYLEIVSERAVDIEQLPIQDRVALKIKHGIPMDRLLINWFWNNTDKFDNVTNSIVKEFDSPSIRAVSQNVGIDTGTFQDIYKLNSRIPAQRSGTF